MVHIISLVRKKNITHDTHYFTNEIWKSVNLGGKPLQWSGIIWLAIWPNTSPKPYNIYLSQLALKTRTRLHSIRFISAIHLSDGIRRSLQLPWPDLRIPIIIRNVKEDRRIIRSDKRSDFLKYFSFEIRIQ